MRIVGRNTPQPRSLLHSAANPLCKEQAAPLLRGHRASGNRRNLRVHICTATFPCSLPRPQLPTIAHSIAEFTPTAMASRHMHSCARSRRRPSSCSTGCPRPPMPPPQLMRRGMYSHPPAAGGTLKSNGLPQTFSVLHNTSHLTVCSGLQQQRGAFDQCRILCRSLPYSQPPQAPQHHSLQGCAHAAAAATGVAALWKQLHSRERGAATTWATTA